MGPEENTRRPRRLHALALAIQIAFAGEAWSLPQGAHVVNGQVTLSQTAAGRLEISAGHGAIINWQRFSIAPGEVARFVQPSAQSAVLNRVTGPELSQLQGLLQANGRVFLVNPNGIAIGSGARVDTNGFVASTLDIADADFLAGRMRFSQAGVAGSIHNEGFITTGPGGQVVLVAPDIVNSGIVHAPGGQILLAAGRRVEIGSPDLPGVNFEIQAPTDSALNLGQLLAENGAVRVFAASVRNEGTIRADRLAEGADGRIVLAAAGDLTLGPQSILGATAAAGGRIELNASGTTRVAGLVDARGQDGRGGQVQVLGSQVALEAGSLVDASGATGGGSIRVGGDYQGANPNVANARRVDVAAGATLRADAGAQGDGGRIIVWADENTRFAGSLSARGGAHGGNGGFAEVSGKQQLQFTGSADLSAAHGAAGTLLFDPLDIVVASGGGQMPELVDAFADFPDNVVTIAPDVLAAIDGHVMLQAERDVFVRDAIQLVKPAVGLTILAGGANHDLGGIHLASGISTQQGTVTLRGSGLTGAGGISTGGGAVDIRVAGDLAYSGVIRAGGAGVRLESLNGSILGSPAVDAGRLDAFAAGQVSLRNLSGTVLRLGEVRAGDGIRLFTDAGVAQAPGGRLSGRSLELQASGPVAAGSADAPLQVDVAELRFTGAEAPLHLRFGADTVVRSVTLAGGVAALGASTLTGSSNLSGWAFGQTGAGLRWSGGADARFDGGLTLDVSGGGLWASGQLPGAASLVLRTSDGDLRLGSLQIAGAVVLRAGGAVLGDDGTQSHVGASVLDIAAGGDIRAASGGALRVQAPSIRLDSAGGRFDVRSTGTVSELALGASPAGLAAGAANFSSDQLELQLSATAGTVGLVPTRWDPALQAFRLVARGGGLQVGDLTVAGSLELDAAGTLSLGTLTAPTVVLRTTGELDAHLVGTRDLTLETGAGFRVQVDDAWLERLSLQADLSRALDSGPAAFVSVRDRQGELAQAVSYTAPEGQLPGGGTTPFTAWTIVSTGVVPTPWHVDIRDTSAQPHEGPQRLDAVYSSPGSLRVDLASTALLHTSAQVGDAAAPNALAVTSTGGIRLRATTQGGAVDVRSRQGDIEVDLVSTVGSTTAGEVSLQADQGSIRGDFDLGQGSSHVFSGPGARVSLSAGEGSVGGADPLRIADAGEISVRARDGIGLQVDGAPLASLAVEASVTGSDALAVTSDSGTLQIGRQDGQLTLGSVPASLATSFSLTAGDGGIAVVAPVSLAGDLGLRAQGGDLSLRAGGEGLAVWSGGRLELLARDDIRVGADAAGSVLIASGGDQRLVAGRDLLLASGSGGGSVRIESGGAQDLRVGGAVSLHNLSGDEVRLHAAGGTQSIEAASLDVTVAGTGRFAGLSTGNGHLQAVRLQGIDGIAGSAALSLRNTSSANGSLAALDSSGAIDLQAGGFGWRTAGAVQVGSADSLGASRIQAATQLGLTAGSLQIQGGATAAAWAAVNAPDAMTLSTLQSGIGLRGGTAGAASIDPARLMVTANGSVLLQGGGSGAASTITAGTFHLATTQGGLTLQLNTGGAAIHAQAFVHYFPGWDQVVDGPVQVVLAGLPASYLGHEVGLHWLTEAFRQLLDGVRLNPGETACE